MNEAAWGMIAFLTIAGLIGAFGWWMTMSIGKKEKR